MRALLVSLIALPCPALAEELRLGLPVDCVPGETCYIQQGVDHDAGTGTSDFRCGPQSYDGHKGTDSPCRRWRIRRRVSRFWRRRKAS